jgi:hypothetical protein
MNPRAGWKPQRRENPLPLPEIESRFLGCPARSLVNTGSVSQLRTQLVEMIYLRNLKIVVKLDFLQFIYMCNRLVSNTYTVIRKPNL